MSIRQLIVLTVGLAAVIAVARYVPVAGAIVAVAAFVVWGSRQLDERRERRMREIRRRRS